MKTGETAAKCNRLCDESYTACDKTDVYYTVLYIRGDK